MQNSVLQQKTAAQQFEDWAKGLVNIVTASSPLLLVLIILGIAVTNGIVEYLFQVSFFGPYALFPAILAGGFRFVSGMGGISLIKKQAYVTGFFFVLASLLATYYIYSHAANVAGAIVEYIASLPESNVIVTEQAIKNAKAAIVLIVWGGFGGELMLAGYMGSKSQPTINNQQPVQESQIEKALTREKETSSTSTPPREGQHGKAITREELKAIVAEIIKETKEPEPAKPKIITDEKKIAEALGNLNGHSPNGQH